MADAIEGMAYSKAAWISDFGHGKRKRPDHELETQRRLLDVLRQAASDYRKAAERAEG